MNILENIINALGSIWSNKLRSGLTMLGIIIGIASVVLMVAIGQGAQKQVTDRIQGMGSNLLIVVPGSPTQTNVRSAGRGTTSASLTNDDVDAVRQNVTGISGVSPELKASMQAIVGNLNMSTSISGVTPAYETVSNFPLEYGSFITDEHLQNTDKVAVLGLEVVRTLFPGDSNPIGKDIRIENHIFTVIGIMSEKGSSGFTNSDDIIFIPLSTMQQRIRGGETVSILNVAVEDSTQMTYVSELITAVLLNEHRIKDPTKQDFNVVNQADAVETLNEVTGVFTLLLGGIAGISLLVGGIGVMNIMLVSVTERTREIGIRKAIGAKKVDIMTQFLVESTVLSVLGGMIGVIISFTASAIISNMFSLEAIISTGSVLLAFVFSIAVGIFFGSLPAYKAATLKPIEALRYE